MLYLDSTSTNVLLLMLLLTLVGALSVDGGVDSNDFAMADNGCLCYLLVFLTCWGSIVTSWIT